jgi:CheY-like chemotaxis protein/phosphoribosyl 1,2-cyclic phosphodiesterase
MTDAKKEPVRILIAEDAEVMAQLMRTALANQGYEVDVAVDGQECLEKVQASPPDLLILDIMLPKVHGIEVLRRLKSDPRTQQVGVIVCTARHYKPDQDEARASGAYDVVTKPFKTGELLSAVERYLYGIRQIRQPEPVMIGKPYTPSIRTDGCYFRLWGTRASIPVSGQRYVRHGGNTSCLEVSKGDECIIVDVGSGIRELGLRLAKRGPRKLHLLITHTHWDHIQGFPFFVPTYIPGFELIIYGAPGFGKDLKSIFRGQLDRDYFPVQFEDMEAKIEFRCVEGDFLQLGSFKVFWEYTHHPAATLAFKFSVCDKTLAYLTDNEFLYGYIGAPQEITPDSPLLVSHQRLVDFLTGVDLLIAEAQYTNEEYHKKIGWGHSSLSNACALAKLSGVKRWVVTHHDPQHTDEFLDRKLLLTKEILKSMNYPIEVVYGYDGFTEYLT